MEAFEKKFVYSVDVEDDLGAGDIDIYKWVGDTLYIFELKHWRSNFCKNNQLKWHKKIIDNLKIPAVLVLAKYPQNGIVEYKTGQISGLANNGNTLNAYLKFKKFEIADFYFNEFVSNELKEKLSTYKGVPIGALYRNIF